LIFSPVKKLTRFRSHGTGGLTSRTVDEDGQVGLKNTILMLHVAYPGRKATRIFDALLKYLNAREPINEVIEIESGSGKAMWLSGLPHKNCSDDFSLKSLIPFMATIDSAQAQGT
jgi:hypothetical protein